MPKAAKVATVVVVLVGLASVLWPQVVPLASWVGVTETPAPRVVDLRYIGLFGLSTELDSTHPILVIEPNGARWYREETSGLYLDCCDPDRVYADSEDPDNSIVMIWIIEPCRDGFALWARGHQGHMVGVMLDGELVQVARLESVPREVIAISVSGTKRDANILALKILQEGFGLTP